MTLSTHGATGAVVVALLPTHFYFALVLAFFSHFVLDAIPHLDYPLRSLDKKEEEKGVVDMKFGLAFIYDLMVVGADALFGLILAGLVSFLILGSLSPLFLLGAFVAMVPDGLQFVYGKVRWRWLGLVQAFHVAIHTEHKMKGKIFLGIVSQVSLVIFIVGLGVVGAGFL